MIDRMEIVRSFSEAWNRRDLDDLMAFFTDDCVYAASIGPEPGMTFRGRAAVRAGIAAMFRHDDGSTAETGRTFTDGQVVFSEWVYRFPAGSGRAPAHGCDVFEFDGNRISLKDAFRKQVTPQTGVARAAEGSHEIYQPRRFEDLGVWTFAAKRFKLIGISHRLDEAPFASDPGVIAAAHGFAEGLLPGVDAQGGHFDLGFVVLHHGQAANWLLFDWWVEGGIACQILCRSTFEKAMVFERVTQPFLACVWEMIAITHERDAWVETMMGERADAEAYLNRPIVAGIR